MQDFPVKMKKDDSRLRKIITEKKTNEMYYCYYLYKIENKISWQLSKKKKEGAMNYIT